MAKYLDYDGVAYLWKQVAQADADSIKKLGLNYDSDNHSIKLQIGTDAHGSAIYATQTIDAAPFIKDGMIDDVTITTPHDEGGSIWYGGKEYANSGDTEYVKFLKFLWNVADENPTVQNTAVGHTNKVDYILLTDMAPAYTASADSGITIKEGSVSAKIDGADSNYLKNDAAGMKVTEMGANVTKTKVAIPIAGGALADDIDTANLPDDWKKDGGYEIPAGKNIEQILKDLLCKEKYPANPTVTPGDLSSKFGEPSFTLTNSNKTVEVGSTVTVSTCTGFNPTPTVTPRKYSGFDYGYATATGEPAVVIKGNPTEVKVENVGLNTGDFKLSRTYKGFGKPEIADTSVNANASSCEIATETLTVAEGDNTVTFKMEGPGHKGTVASSVTYYAASNLKNVIDKHKVVSQGSQKLTVPTATAGSKTLKVTGARYMFWGGYGAVAAVDSTRVRDLATGHAGGTKAATTGVLNIAGDNIQQFIIAVPSNRKLVKVTNDKVMNADITSKFDVAHPQVVQVEGANKYSAAAYNVYVFNSDTVWDRAELTITIA